jgi:predicted NBD/HSP70 family sugar kinase
MIQKKQNRLGNTSRVIREIWINKEISRVLIARNLGLDKSTVSSIVSDLLALGLIQETAEGAAGPQGGRKPVFLTLNRSYGCVLGVEFRPESYNAVAVDLEGNILYSQFELARLTGSDLTDGMLAILQRLHGDLKRTSVPLLGIGVGMSGVVNSKKSILRYSIPMQVETPYDFGREIAGRMAVPAFLENDANACAWGELAFHRMKKLQDFLFLLVEFRDIQDRTRFHERTAVGMGIVINGRVYHGHNFSAGEFRSALCTPESRGQFSLSEEEAFRIEEDPEILRRFIGELAANIAMIVNTFNLSSVFLGGDIERYKRDVQAVLGEAIQRNWPYPDGVSCKIQFSSLGEKAVAYGAAGMVLHRLFTDLDLTERVGHLPSSAGRTLGGAAPTGEAQPGVAPTSAAGGIQGDAAPSREALRLGAPAGVEMKKTSVEDFASRKHSPRVGGVEMEKEGRRLV